MGIDKCRNRKLIRCPRLFSRRYKATFPVQDGPVHFVRISLSINSVWLKKEFDRRQWHKIATWHYDSPPMPHSLRKLKDVMTPCEQVMASKGKCCR